MPERLSRIPNPVKGPDTLKSEHLKDKSDAIMFCVVTPDQFRKSAKSEAKSPHDKLKPVWNVDWLGNTYELEDMGFATGGNKTFVISPIDGKDKYSNYLFACPGVIVSGRDKTTGRNISFLCHTDPFFFLRTKKNKSVFTKALQQRLIELRDKSVTGTIDAVITGGDYPKNEPKKQRTYIESIKLLSAETMGALRFEPVVLTGPKVHGSQAAKEALSEYDQIYYSNHSRKMYIIRPRVGDASTESFMSKDIETKKEKW